MVQAEATLERETHCNLSERYRLRNIAVQLEDGVCMFHLDFVSVGGCVSVCVHACVGLLSF
jgi:hypothetical protein